MKEGSIVTPIYDYLAASGVLERLGYHANEWPSPGKEYMVDSLCNTSLGTGLRIVDIHCIYKPDNSEVVFVLRHWREIEPPLDIEQLVEESICQTI